MPRQEPEQPSSWSWHWAVNMLLPAACIWCAPVGAQVTAPEQFQSLRSAILQRLGADSIPSLSLAVARDGKVVWEEAFGHADTYRRVPATTTTRYPIASVSKPLTATALMVLVEQGRLALEDPANEHLEAPGIQAGIGSARDVTIERLAAHTAGLARHDIFSYDDEAYRPLTIQERIRRYGRVVRIPGKDYEYSNLGYEVLAHLIARRSGRPFGDVLREAVFAPLGMTHSSPGRPGTQPGEVALPHDDRRMPVPIREGAIPGAGGVYSTAGDLVRFGMLHAGHVPGSAPTVLSPAMLASMRVPRVQTDSGEWYAIGWRVNRTAFGVETIYHSGSNGASASIVAVVPGEGIVVAALANCVTALPGYVAREVIASLGPRPAPEPHPPAYPTARLGEAPYRPADVWTGRWEGTIRAPDATVPVMFEFTPAGPILVRVAGAARADTASGVRIQNGYLRGSFSGEIPNRDTMARRYRLHFKLVAAGDRLTGSTTAGSIAGERVITLSYWTDLRRAPR